MKTLERVESRVQLGAEEGFDVYVDGVRFLPDNVSLSRVVFKAMLPNYAVVGQDSSAVADLDSEMLSPTFHTAYRAFRSAGAPEGGRWPAGLTLVFRVDTLESHTQEPQVAGYAVLNVFVPGPRTRRACT
jgi:hypothetical protein